MQGAGVGMHATVLASGLGKEQKLCLQPCRCRRIIRSPLQSLASRFARLMLVHLSACVTDCSAA